jgi:nucleotidyltransferase substrate binding protein (TIGR01987 family)
MITEQTLLKLNTLEQGLFQLEEAIQMPATQRIIIDGTIQRFEFTIELFWKTLKHILQDLGKEAPYPRIILKSAYEGHLIDDEALWLGMLKDRNEIAHVYNQAKADELYGRIKIYTPILRKTLDHLKTYCNNNRL